MELINFCPDCGKHFSQSKKYCACGWKISANDASHANQICSFVTSEGRCTELGTIRQSVVVRPDLRGLDFEIAVISAREHTLALFD